MTLREFKQNIDKMLKDNPELADLPVIYSCDDEGNSYQKVVFTPTPMQVHNINELDLELVGIFRDPGINDKDINCVCIN